MAGPVLSQRTQQRLIVAAALGVGGYAAYCAWRDNARLRKAVHSTVAELQRCGEWRWMHSEDFCGAEHLLRARQVGFYP